MAQSKPSTQGSGGHRSWQQNAARSTRSLNGVANGHQHRKSSRFSRQRAALQHSRPRRAGIAVSSSYASLFAHQEEGGLVPMERCAKAMHACSRRIVRAFLIEEQKIVKKVVKLQQQQKAGQA
jgi:hypothetical protein